MNILQAVISSISDFILLNVQINVLIVTSNKNYSKARYIFCAMVAVITGFMLELFFPNVNIHSVLIFVLIYSLRLPLLALFAVKLISIKNVLIVMIIQFLCSVLHSAIIAVIPDVCWDKFPYVNLVFLVIIPLCMLITAITIKKMIKNSDKLISETMLSIPTHNYIYMLVAIIIENGLIEVLGYKTEKIESQMEIAKLLSLLLIICITILIVSLAVNVVYQKYYNSLNHTLSKQVEMQLHHYEKREELNSEIRSFRHDFNNHIKCLESLIKNKRYTEAENYLEKLNNLMPTGEFLFRTGNYIADAILTEAQENSRADDIIIEFNGYIPQEIDNVDLCIILSNAINNSTEACCPMAGTKVVSVYGNYQQKIFVLIIKNPTSLDGFAKDVFPESSKSDKLSHGFGFSNMQHIVNKYNGIMHTLVEDGYFTLSITLNIS